MVAKILVLVIASFACVFNLANCLSAPFPGFKPCKVDDEECLLQNAIDGVPYLTDGIPELGVERLDPDFFDRVDSISPNLKFILSNVTSTGLKTCKPLKVKLNTSKSNLVIQLQCALKLDGNYEIDGQVLVLKIAGKGKIHIFIRKLVSTLLIDYVIKEGKDGKNHIRIKKFHHTYELKDKSDVELDGLFEDNAVLRQAAVDLFKNSGNEVIQEIGGEMFKTSITRTVENVNKFFANLDYDEITLDGA